MIVQEKEALKITKQCPRFNKCSVNICPLDLNQDIREKVPDEQKCTLAKSIRSRIGKGTKLKYQGLTSREFKGKLRWESLSDEEKDKIKARTKNIHLLKVSSQQERAD